MTEPNPNRSENNTRPGHSQITILAPGLLGASLAMAAHARRLTQKTVVWARRAEIRHALKASPWCQEVVSTPSAAVKGSSMVLVCAPVDRIVPLIQEISPSLAPGAIVTDVGSVKGGICRLAHEAVGRNGFFVGSHPMAGSEKSGMEHATGDLFENRPCFVTPLDRTPFEATERVVAFWTAIGAQVVTASPEEHDEIVAHISHLPHLLASVLCSLLQLQNPAWGNYSGPGLRDTTRVAGGNPRLWKEILRLNQDEALRAIRSFQNELEGFQAALANNDFFQVANYLERGKQYRDRLRLG